MTKKSTRKRTKYKPSKPYPDFALYPHSNGQLAKNIKQQTHYFGPWENWQNALDLYLKQKDGLQAERKPRGESDGLCMKNLCNEFLTMSQNKMNRNEIENRTFGEYHRFCNRIINFFGEHRLVPELKLRDFEEFRTSFPENWGPVTVGKKIAIARMLFAYAWNSDLINNPVKFGTAFKKPSAKTLRQNRQNKRQKHGKRMYKAKQLRTIIDSCPLPLKAMVLLCINGGFGQTDCSTLPNSAVDLNVGWIDYARPKTGIDRRVPLWKETIEALQQAIEKRPRSKNPEDDSLVFITKYGLRWVKPQENGSSDDAVAKRLAKVLDSLSMKRKGLNFYALRHTFLTVAEQTKDAPAVRQIMGHVDPHVAASYREEIGDKRLKAVTDHVHAWLFGKKKRAKRG